MTDAERLEKIERFARRIVSATSGATGPDGYSYPRNGYVQVLAVSIVETARGD